MAAASLLSREVADICIGKPALRALPPSAAVGEALRFLKSSSEEFVGVLAVERVHPPERKAVAGRVCLADVLCFLCDEENVAAPAEALKKPVFELLLKDAGRLVRCVEPHSSIREALDVILEGAQSLVVPIRPAGRRKLAGSGGAAADFCWLTPEDFVRFFLNAVALFSPAAALSVSALGLVCPDAAIATRVTDPAASTLPLIRRALADGTAVAVLTDDGRLAGEIIPSALSAYGETAAAAMAALSAGDLMAYLDCFGSPPESVLRAIRTRLKEKGLGGLLELMEAEEENYYSPTSPNSFSPSLSSGSATSSSDEESGPGRGRRRRPRRLRKSWGWRTEEAVACHPGSSLVAVMVQALAHRVSHVWVVDEDDYSLVGVVTFAGVLKVLREQLQRPSLTREVDAMS